MSRIANMTKCKHMFRFASPMIKGIAFYVLVFAFVLRSLVPAGFMPQYNGESGLITIEICTPEGSYTVDMMLDGETGGDSHQDALSHGHACTFGSLTLQLFGADQANTEIAFFPHIRLAIFGEHRVNLPYFSVFGTPLGSRAPPQSAIL